MSVITEESNFDFDGIDISVKFVTAPFAKGFQCATGVCGLCCITEAGQNIARQIGTLPFKGINRCRAFDLELKECRHYENRPSECRIYPFMIIYGGEEVIFSPDLNCPCVSNSSNYTGIGPVINFLQNDGAACQIIKKDFEYSRMLHQQLVNAFSNKFNLNNEVLISQIPFEDVLRIVQNSVIHAAPDELLNAPESWMRTCYVEAFSQCGVEPTENFKGEDAKEEFIDVARKMKMLKPTQIALLMMKAEGRGTYNKPITKENENPSIITYKIKGNKLKFTDIINDEVSVVRLSKLPEHIEMSSKSYKHFLAYAELLLARKPFADLFPKIHFNNFPLWDYLDRIISPIETVSALAKIIAAREGIESIDSDTFREILSWSDAKFHGYIKGRLFEV